MVRNEFNKHSSRIIGIQFSLMSPDEIRKNSVVQITSRDTYINGKPVVGGLFDPRMGLLESGLVCPTDGHSYIQCPGYFGHIDLARPVYYIQYLNTIIKILRCTCIKCSKLLINKEKYKYFMSMDSRKRWQKVFSIASKVERCGESTCDGCGCKPLRAENRFPKLVTSAHFLFAIYIKREHAYAGKRAGSSVDVRGATYCAPKRVVCAPRSPTRPSGVCCATRIGGCRVRCNAVSGGGPNCAIDSFANAGTKRGHTGVIHTRFGRGV